MARDKLLDRVYESLVSIIAPVATSNPRNLKPGETVKLLNSTPLGTVLDDRSLRKHRDRAGMRIGDGKTIDLLRYAAWLVNQPRASAAVAPKPAPEPVDAYTAKRERERLRNAATTSKGRDVAAAIEEAKQGIDWEARGPAEEKLRAFALTYCKDDFKIDPSEMHEEVIETLERCVCDGGWFALAMPRGSGKTTLTVIAALWAILTGRTLFVVILAATNPKAKALLDRIKRYLETNELLLRDFPEVCIPLKEINGNAQKCRGQHYKGQRTYMEYGKDVLVLPTVPNSKSAGAIIMTGGLLSSATRGPIYKHPDGRNLRPTLAICDDPQTRRSARSRPQNEERFKTLTQDVIGMAGPGVKMAVIVPCTVILPGDMADQLLDRELNPDFQGRKYQLFESMPKNIELWKEYHAIYRRCKASGKCIKPATDFYKKCRKKMDEGCVPTWPNRYYEDEASAIQHGMTIWLRDPEYFACEMQNTPLKESLEEAEDWYLSVDEISERVNGIARGKIPNWANTLVAHIDMQKRMLFWSLAAVGDGFTIAVPDYNTLPEQPRNYFTYRDAPVPLKTKKGQGYDAVIQEALTKLIETLFGMEWEREDGHKMKLDRVLIDTGYENRIVHQVCRASPFRASLYPAKGVGITAKKRPISAYVKKDNEVIGEEWILKPAAAHGSRLLEYDTNYWKTFAHKRLATAYGNPGNGSCTINGRKDAPHRLLAEHWRSEKPIKILADGKRELFEWVELPSKPDNHWFDTFVGSLVAASTLGHKLGIVAPSSKTTPKKPRKERVRYINL